MTLCSLEDWSMDKAQKPRNPEYFYTSSFAWLRVSGLVSIECWRICNMSGNIACRNIGKHKTFDTAESRKPKPHIKFQQQKSEDLKFICVSTRKSVAMVTSSSVVSRLSCDLEAFTFPYMRVALSVQRPVYASADATGHTVSVSAKRLQKMWIYCLVWCDAV
jgi:hypothetical protein